MRRLLALSCATLILTACSGQSDEGTPTDSQDAAATVADVRDAIAAGDDCPALFEIRNRIDKKSGDVDEANIDLRKIGCFSAGSSRNDLDSPDAGTSECVASMRTAANETDSAAANPLILATLTACETADIWLAVLADYPGVMGMQAGYTPAKIDLQAACRNTKDTPVCADAFKQGLLP